MPRRRHEAAIPIAEAARLLGTPPRTLRRWLAGYRSGPRWRPRAVPPLLPARAGGARSAVGARDLLELRFVVGFLRAGLPLAALRGCLGRARASLGSDRPLSSGRFRTDGRHLILDGAGRDDPPLDVCTDQYLFRPVVEPVLRAAALDEGSSPGRR